MKRKAYITDVEADTSLDYKKARPDTSTTLSYSTEIDDSFSQRSISQRSELDSSQEIEIKTQGVLEADTEVKNNQKNIRDTIEYFNTESFINEDDADNYNSMNPTNKYLNRDISNFKDLPPKSDKFLRVISYNIGVDFFDAKDNTEGKIHHWKIRDPFCKELINRVTPDIFCLQELSPTQSSGLSDYFKNFGYSAKFLSQTPSDIDAGRIVDGDFAKNWIGKNIGTPLIGTFYSNQWQLLEEKCFWLNSNPDEVPSSKDRGNIDKGFGNMNTYRAVLCTKFEMTDNPAKTIYIFNSHYPLSGSSKTIQSCAKIEMQKIQEIAKDSAWISAGDRNLIPRNTDTEDSNPELAYRDFVKYGHDMRDANNHYGISTSWIGFSYELPNIKNNINERKDAKDIGDFIDNTVLDLIISNMPAEDSFHLHGAFDLNLGLLPITEDLNTSFNDNRLFSSDHALIGADFNLDLLID